MIELKVSRPFLLNGKPVATGEKVCVNGWMADYLLGLNDPPVATVQAGKASPKNVPDPDGEPGSLRGGSPLDAQGS